MKPTKPKPKRINPYYAFGGMEIPGWLVERTEVSADAKLVFAGLLHYEAERNHDYGMGPNKDENGRNILDPLRIKGPAQETHAAALGMPLAVWVKAANDLGALKLLTWDDTGLADLHDNGWHEAAMYRVQQDDSIPVRA